jgi:thiosulfate/3-mercaptopyruvate sulfurtransferase
LVTDKSHHCLLWQDWVRLARVFMTLDYLGQVIASIWTVVAGLAGRESRRRRRISDVSREVLPRPNAGLVVDAAWVSANLNKPGVAILDARAAKFYTGEDAGQMPRGGHIPHAKSIPFSTLVDDKTNKFKSPEALRTLFGTAGVKENDSVATYCHIGQQASLLYFVARYLGYEAHLYDGSFQDWSNRSELPVEKSNAPAAKP